MNLPEPRCTLGYPEDQLKEMLGETYERFGHWMYGQTGAICISSNLGEPCSAGPHGMVVYPHDLRNFLEGGRIVD